MKDKLRQGFGVAWRGVAWRGVVWCGVVRCGVAWCGVVWNGVVWCGAVRCGELCDKVFGCAARRGGVCGVWYVACGCVW